MDSNPRLNIRAGPPDHVGLVCNLWTFVFPMNHFPPVLLIPEVKRTIMQNKNFRIRLGIFMMIFSGVFFGAALIIPMLDIPVKIRVIAVSVSLVLMEIVFWAGGLLVGKELFVKYKQRLNPIRWFKKEI